MKPDKRQGARRELKLALARLRASATHLRHAESVNWLPPSRRDVVRKRQAEVRDIELGILADLRAVGSG